MNKQKIVCPWIIPSEIGLALDNCHDSLYCDFYVKDGVLWW